MSRADELIQSGKKNLDSENYVDAISFFDQALALKPDSPDIWNLKGIALRSLGRYDEASECYNKSLKLDPRDKASS